MATGWTLAASSASTRACPRATSHSRCGAPPAAAWGARRRRRRRSGRRRRSPTAAKPPPQGKGNFYDLETLLFFAKHVDAKFTDYFKKAGKEIGQGKAVTFVDRKVRPHSFHCCSLPRPAVTLLLLWCPDAGMLPLACVLASVPIKRQPPAVCLLRRRRCRRPGSLALLWPPPRRTCKNT